VWGIPDEDRRQRVTAEFFRLYAKAFLRHDETYTSGGAVVAAALANRERTPRGPAVVALAECAGR
jgi:hypothetical protein